MDSIYENNRVRKIITWIAGASISLLSNAETVRNVAHSPYVNVQFVETSNAMPVKDLESMLNFKISKDKNNFEEEIEFEKERYLLAKMIFGEAGNFSQTEKIAVAYTALNRVNEGCYGKNLKEVIEAPYQYSCFIPSIKKRMKLDEAEKLAPEKWKECTEIAGNLLKGEYKDPTSGATHYYNPSIVKYPGWKKMKKIGRIKTEEGKDSAHLFFRELN